jgi:outer membrane lipoprotein-sorting protein
VPPVQSRPMASRTWDRAGSLPVAVGDGPGPELVALPGAALLSVEALFTFMRDAERRFETLRMRVEEVKAAAGGDVVVATEVLLEHPARARVTTTEPAGDLTGNYEVWLSDGARVRTYSARHRLATDRPVRPRVRGADAADLPGFARVYRPLTPLPMESLPDLFVHPAGYCQNVLATGRCDVLGTAGIVDREAILLRSAHPRAVERWADRPDFAIELLVDRETGCILRLTELMGEAVTRDARVVVFEPDAPLPPSAFELAVPEGATTIF